MIIEIGILSAFLNMFINYSIGKPASQEFSPYEIFSQYTVWLSIRRLKQIGLYDTYKELYEDNFQRIKSPHEEITAAHEFKKLLYNAADPFFSWERMVGMCPVCTGFWVSLLSAICFTTNIIEIIEIIVISHVTIRLLSKFL